jgi:dihydrofolate reductase
MISIIVAVGKNRAIGRSNQLLWNIPEDMRYFQEKTMGKTVVMGDKTFLSIGKPLPGRRNIVVTLDPDFMAEGVEISNSLDDILEAAKKFPAETFIIGGGQIYALAFPHADKLYITEVDDSPADADTFFPDYSEFGKEVSRREGSNSEYKFTFLELLR